MSVQFPILYHKGSKGTIYSWRVWTEGADIVTEYGQLARKMQIARKTATPKNVGRSNETTPIDQALSEAKSMWTFKVERKYKESIDDAEDEEVFLPMLADTFEKRKGKKKDGHTYPCDIQPKLDGVRCLAFWEGNEIKLMSRGGKYWNCPHITEWLSQYLDKNLVLDGELYIHGETFQAITRLVKKHRPETKNIKLNVYDCVMLDNREAQWPERKERINKFAGVALARRNAPVWVVDTSTAESEEQVYDLQGQFMEEGYEGAVVRCYDNSAYRFGYRSKRLLKVKTFDDGEFKVIGHSNNGVGKFKNCILWLCVTEGGEEFEVTPKGSMEYRRSLINEAAAGVGQMLKVKYIGFSEAGIPKHAVGEGFRLPKDMS